MCQMHNLEMPALRDILNGSVGMYNNYNLCHIKTINWEEIITGQGGKYLYVYNFTSPERVCPECDKSCEQGCWGEGPENCQRYSKTNCSPQCWQGRCFGPNPRECCHLFCAGGCTGPKQSDCLACKNFFDDGVCTQECPPMQKYNPTTYSWEANPDGKYAYGATCVRKCPEHLLKDNGACVRSCPPKKKVLNGECVPCDGPCPKTCKGVEKVHSGNIDSFKDCTIIEGSITILDQSFEGFQDIYPNFTFAKRYKKMHPDKLEVFSTLKEITGYLNIQGDHKDFTNLSYFRNLEVIGGRTLTEYFSSLYIVKTSLVSLGLSALKKIYSGAIAILENKKLCYAQSINWSRIKKSSEHDSLYLNNRNESDCKAENLVCDEQCSDEGCWGPGPAQCLSCRNFILGNDCLQDCVASGNKYISMYLVVIENNYFITGHYYEWVSPQEQGALKPLAGKAVCRKCHPRCKKCTGYGFHEQVCQQCTKYKRGEQCEDECPADHFADAETQLCIPCFGECRGCFGSGPNQCYKCRNYKIYILLRYNSNHGNGSASHEPGNSGQHGHYAHPNGHCGHVVGSDSSSSRYCSDPLKMVVVRDCDVTDDCFDTEVNTAHQQAQVGNLKLDLPLDEDDYLMPSPQLPTNTTQYMDLIGDTKPTDSESKRVNNGYRKYPEFLTIQGKTSLDNPEYIMSQDEGPLTPQTLGIPTPDLEKVLTNGAFGSQVRQRSSEEESDHEYYNDFDRLERELQPLKPFRKNETTV
ncbi:epidermal growth factor receptor isoform X1 [Vespula squamosa]|uniref:receptor protein-tyrosine kinase n=1 Tax=Vespula squamosa TaxID=30214 RepID=A0ABD2AD44_VESSQ